MGFVLSPANRGLLWQLVQREAKARYQGSFLGFAWSFVTPLLMLLVYTFVFHFVFKARWPDLDDRAGSMEFTAVLFAGLILHALASEVLGRSAQIICDNANYVKKVVFPLQLLPLVLLINAAINFIIGFALVLLFMLAVGMSFHWHILLAPLVLLPYLALLYGLSLFLAAAGVYIRDIQQVMGTATTLMLFVSPVFYSVANLPDWIRTLIYINPISVPVEQFRAVVVFGLQPHWMQLLFYSAVSLLFLCIGFVFFQRSRKGFADVI